MFGDVRRFMSLTTVDCSQLVSKVDNYTTLANPNETQKEPSYFTEPYVCLTPLKDYSTN